MTDNRHFLVVRPLHGEIPNAVAGPEILRFPLNPTVHYRIEVERHDFDASRIYLDRPVFIARETRVMTEEEKAAMEATQDIPVIDLEDCDALSEAGWYETTAGKLVEEAESRHEAKHGGDFHTCPKLACRLARQMEHEAVKDWLNRGEEVKTAGKDCPCCGGAAVVVRFPDSPPSYRVVCGMCDLQTDKYTTAEGAEARWSERVQDDRVERLTEALDGVTVAWQRVRTALAAVKEA